MSSVEEPPRFTAQRGVVLGAALLILILGGALIAGILSPHAQSPRNRPAPAPQPRPILQIVRQQPGLPDLADLVDRLCPSIAIVIAQGADPADDRTVRVRAFAYSADGWLVAAGPGLPPMPLDVLFGDGRRANVTEVRTDPVSGLAIVKADATATPLPFSDQAFPRVGQFGLALATPVGNGCSAAAAMIGSDFIADGDGAAGDVRLRPPPDDWTAGTPVLGGDGRVLGVGSAGRPGTLIPSPIASVVIDELVRNSHSSSTDFGFRIIDYADPVSSRLGDVRTGAGVAIVQTGSPAAKAGLQAGDLITAVDDQPVSGASELGRLLDTTKRTAKLTVQRRARQLRVTIAKL